MQDLSSAKVLVTGGTGFVGRHLRRRLRQLGCPIVLLARRAEATDTAEQWVVGDLTDAAFVSRTLSTITPDVIFHLASTRERSVTAEAFRHTVVTNLPLAINVFAAASSLPGLTSLVTLGTAEEYGSGSLPFTEPQREAPVSAYSLSKLCITHLAQIMNRAHGLPAVVLRAGILYGPGQPDDMLVAQLFAAARSGEPLPMTLGEQTRDFLFVEDAVDALLQAAMTPAARGEVINVGSGREMRLMDLVRLIEKITGRREIAKLGAKPYRPYEIMRYALDQRKALQVLGWEARTSLDEGMKHTWREIG